MCIWKWKHFFFRSLIQNLTSLIKLGKLVQIQTFLLKFMLLYICFSPLFLRQDEKDTANRLVVIQCDSGHKNGTLIACARYRIYDERIKAINKNKLQNRVGVTHVVFIINLPHQVSSSSSFVGFQGDPWISCHIDDLRPTSGKMIEPLQAISANISELFIGEYICDIRPLLDTVCKQQQQQVSVVESEEDPHEVESRMMTTSLTPERQLEEEEGEESTKESDKESDVHSLSGEGDKDRVKNEEDQISIKDSLPPQDFDEQTVFTQQELTLEGAESVRSPGDMEVIDIEEQPQEIGFASAYRPEDENITDEIYGYKGDNAMDLSLSKPKHVTIDRCPIAQCQRLYGCIQAAASYLEDATKDRSTQRVSRLTKLIPRDPVEHIGKYFSAERGRLSSKSGPGVGTLAAASVV